MARRDIDIVRWDRWWHDRFHWNQGEHVTIIGPTGSGKTNLAHLLSRRRGWVCALATKPDKDATLAGMVNLGWTKFRQWPPGGFDPSIRRAIIWPRLRTPTDFGHQTEVLREAIAQLFIMGGWCMSVDETWYLVQTLGLGADLSVCWQQGRSNGLSILAAANRPRFVPIDAYSNARHLFIYKTSHGGDIRELENISAAGDVDTGVIREYVAKLPRHAFLHVDAHTGRLSISRAPAPGDLSVPNEELTA